MKKITYIGFIWAMVASFVGCDYNDRNFEGLDEMVVPAVKGPFALEYTEKTFSAENPANKVLPDWLFSQIYTADTGAVATVKYQFSEPSQNPFIREDFEKNVLDGMKTEIENWINYTKVGNKFWEYNVYSGNVMTEMSAYKSGEACEGWLISPKFKVSKGMAFSFDYALRFYKGACLKVLVSSNFGGVFNDDLKWEDITAEMGIPDEEVKEMKSSTVLNLDRWLDKNIVIAFQYSGDDTQKKTTTVQLDNILVSKLGSTISEKEDEYVFRGYPEKWVFVREVPQYALNETFEREIVSKNPTVLPGWLNVAQKGEDRWIDKSFSGNTYTEFSAFKKNNPCEVWLVTPQLDINEPMVFSFDVTVGHYKGDCLSVWISTDFDGQENNIGAASWAEITSSFSIPQEPENGYGTMGSAGELDLSEYVGKRIFIAFKYEGSAAEGKTTTYQLDNIFVGKK